MHLKLPYLKHEFFGFGIQHSRLLKKIETQNSTDLTFKLQTDKNQAPDTLPLEFQFLLFSFRWQFLDFGDGKHRESLQLAHQPLKAGHRHVLDCISEVSRRFCRLHA